jgi:hypothetical protein
LRRINEVIETRFVVQCNEKRLKHSGAPGFVGAMQEALSGL